MLSDLLLNQLAIKKLQNILFIEEWSGFAGNKNW
jgi:hypothetical protein